MTARTRFPIRGRPGWSRWFTLSRLGVIALGLIVLVLIVVIGRTVLFPGGPSLTGLRTATADTGTVASTVTGTGSVAPATQQDLSFRASGVLTEVDVKVGDTVSPGQVLARIDPSAQQLALTQAQSQLQQARSQLDSTQNGTALRAAWTTLGQAQQSYDDTLSQASLTEQQDANQVAADQQKLSGAQAQYAGDTGCGTPQGSASCATDKQAVASAQTALQSDLNKQEQDQVGDQVKQHQAQNTITNAQIQVSQQTVTRQTTIAGQQAAVVSDQAQVANAQQTLGYTTLTAPIAGTVTAVNGTVGSSPGAASSSSTSGSGTGQSTGQTGAAASTGGTTSSSSGAGFIALSDASTFQVSAPFAETDAARVQTSQPAQVTFDAIPGLTIPGSVAAVAPSATVVSNVTDYAVTLALNQLDPRLKEGMTANVTVTVNSVSGAVRVPNAAIQSASGQPYATLVSSSGVETRVPVQTGLVGDTYTEVTSGLNSGDVVLLPQVTTGASTGGAGVRIPGGGGGGGGGRGGGFGGGG